MINDCFTFIFLLIARAFGKICVGEKRNRKDIRIVYYATVKKKELLK